MCGLRISDRLPVEAVHVVRAQDRDVPSCERGVDQCLVLDARRVLHFAAAGPDRFADDADAAVGMPVGEGAQDTGDDAPGVGAGLGHVDHVHAGRGGAQGVLQEAQVACRYGGGDGLAGGERLVDERDRARQVLPGTAVVQREMGERLFGPVIGR
jgi:hypothetical protein